MSSPSRHPSEFPHMRSREFERVRAREQSESERQHARVQRVLARRLVETQVAERGKRVGEPVDRRFRQAGALGEIAIAEQNLARPERAQQLQPASERDDELALVDRLRRGEITNGIRRHRVLNSTLICKTLFRTAEFKSSAERFEAGAFR
jgi:hypothetical protein